MIQNSHITRLFYQHRGDTWETKWFSIRSNVQPLPENHMMTYSVLIELARLGKGSEKWDCAAAKLSEEGWKEWMVRWVEKWLQSFWGSPSPSGHTSVKDND